MSIEGLLGYAKSISGKLVKKSDIEDELSDICSSIRNELDPSITLLLDSLSVDDVKLSSVQFLAKTSLAKEYDTASKLLVKIRKVILSIVSNQNDILDYIDNMPKQVSTNSLTTNQALGLHVLDNIRFLIEMSGDILIVIGEYISSTDDSVFPGRILSSRKLLLDDYHNILINYVNIKNMLVDLDNMVITSNNTILAATLSDKSNNIVSRLEYQTKGFNGNPIYHIRLWFRARDIEEIRTLEKKKEYLELLLANHEMQQAGQYDPALEESIENMKDMINSYEARIEKLSKK